jgi:hypothetical protein
MTSTARATAARARARRGSSTKRYGGVPAAAARSTASTFAIALSL